MKSPGPKLLLILSIVILVIAGEVSMRAMQGGHGRSVLSYDDTLIWTFQPGLNVTPFGPPVSINDAGFRDEFPRADTGSEETRIAVLGDSYTAAVRTSEEERFTERLERGLEEDGHSVDVINFGMNAYGTDQEALTYRHVASRFDPEVVILMVSPNDIRETYVKHSLHPGTIRRNLSNRAFNRGPVDRFGWWMAAHSSLFFRFQSLIGLDYGTFDRLFSTTTNGVFFQEDRGLGPGEILFARNETGEMKAALRYWDGIVGALHREVQEDGARFMLVLLPIEIQFTTVPQNPDLSMTKVEDEVSNISARHGIRHVSLLPYVQDHDNPERVFLEEDYHYGPEGHRLVAEALQDNLNGSMPR